MGNIQKDQKSKDFIFEASDFDPKDVINQTVNDYKSNNVQKVNTPTITSENNVDEDTRHHKKKNFDFENQLVNPDAEENFEDFLDLPVITGNYKGFNRANRISSDKIINSSNSINLVDVDFTDSNSPKHHKDDFSTIIINKDQENNVIGIDVICRCGNKTRVNFTFDEKENEIKVEGSNKVKVKDPSYDPTSIDENLPNHIYEAPTNILDDENYNESLLENIDDNNIE